MYRIVDSMLQEIKSMQWRLRDKIDIEADKSNNHKRKACGTHQLWLEQLGPSTQKQMIEFLLIAP